LHHNGSIINLLLHHGGARECGAQVVRHTPGHTKTIRAVTSLLIKFYQGEKIQAILNAAGVTVEPFWPGMFAKALEGRNIGDLLCSVGTPGGGGAPAAGGAAAGGDTGAEEAKEEKKEEKKEESEESDDDMGFGRSNGLKFQGLILLDPSLSFTIICILY
jgi:large subunit ribosomal protein LP1